MYRGFKTDCLFENDEWHKIGNELYNANRKHIITKLESFISEDGFLDGSEMQDNWFPQIEADIFISHSHYDEKAAVSFAGWLYKNFRIKSFIDSCIWGYSNDLLKILDNRYCLNPSGETYSYQKRNYSTSHIHMMLSTALMMMINKTECLFFLNTPYSISPSDVVVDQTESPWIYSEITMSQLIEKKIPVRRVTQDKKYFIKEGMINNDMKMKYKVNLNHLVEVDCSTLVKWSGNKYENVDKVLDALYSICPIKDIKIING